MKMCFLLWSLISWVFAPQLVFANSRSTYPGPVVISINDYPPYYDKNGNGLLTDIVKAAFAEEGLKIKTKSLPIQRGVRQVLDKKVDAHMPGNFFFNQKDRSKLASVWSFNFLIAFFYDKKKYPALGKIDLLDGGVKQLKNWQLGILTNTPYTPIYEKNKLKFQHYGTSLKLIRMLERDRYHLMETSVLAGVSLQKQYYPKEKDRFDYLQWIVLLGSVSFLKDNPRAMYFHEKYNSGFQKIKQNGKYIQILERFWGKGNIPKSVLPEDLKKQGIEKADLSKINIVDYN